ncbi:MAG: hypothetical protein IKR48_01805 [Kiritimatiellae bacterium]|nr:hypothetical protein [Kiritimatiellia bacterium]
MVRRDKNAGQVSLFILLLLVILSFFLLFHVDLQRIISRKDKTRAAGDAAALAAARWQGATANLVGELNLLHALALAADDPDAVYAITNLQLRLAFTGPLTGLYAAQVLAKNNGIHVDPEMTSLLQSHASTIQNLYAASVNGSGEVLFPEPWLGAWSEYAQLLRQVISDGISAGPDNMRTFNDPQDSHYLLSKDFYHAVMGYGWCWFKFHAKGLLESYHSFRDWPPLPEMRQEDYWNSEVFPVHVYPLTRPLNRTFTPEELSNWAQTVGRTSVETAQFASTNVMQTLESWFFYNASDWGSWQRIKPDGEDDFPITGPVREEYDTAGADVVVRVHAEVTRLTPNMNNGSSEDSVVWTAAAKPFGYLDTDLGKEKVTAAAGFVLPAFRNVRLIPVDSASNADASSSDAEWVIHIRGHLKSYLSTGALQITCRYCRALSQWEKNEFRQQGVTWLNEFGSTCRRPSGGTKRGGGTRRGH